MAEDLDQTAKEGSDDIPAVDAASGKSDPPPKVPVPPSKEKVKWVCFAYKLQKSKDSNAAPSKVLSLKGDGQDISIKLTDEDIIEAQLRKYTGHYERYQFYMDISLKVIVSYYLVTAAILTFYFGSRDDPYRRISVLLPIVLGVVWGFVFLYGGYLWWKARRGILTLEKELIDQRLITPPPDFHLLLWLLFVFGLLFLIVAGSIFCVWRPWWCGA